MKIKKVINKLKDYPDENWEVLIWFNGDYYPIHTIVPFRNLPEMPNAIIFAASKPIGEEDED